MKDTKPKLVAPAMSKEELRQLLELRRSSAASRHRNKSKYTRKRKHRNDYM